MTVPLKHHDDCTRVLTSILQSAIEQARYGNMKIASDISLPLPILRLIHQLAPLEIHQIVTEYVKNVDLSQLMTIQPALFMDSIDAFRTQSKQNEMVEKYILHGATKSMMRELFSLHSTQYTSLRRLLNPPNVNNRALSRSPAEQRAIYRAWLDSINTPDKKQRMLIVAELTGLSISKVHREVQEIESVTQPLFVKTERNQHHVSA